MKALNGLLQLTCYEYYGHKKNLNFSLICYSHQPIFDTLMMHVEM